MVPRSGLSHFASIYIWGAFPAAYLPLSPPQLAVPALPLITPPPPLQSLAVTFPQSLYYSLRTSLLSLREGAHRAASDMQKARLKAQEDGVEWTSECDWGAGEGGAHRTCQRRGSRPRRTVWSGRGMRASLAGGYE